MAFKALSNSLKGFPLISSARSTFNPRPLLSSHTYKQPTPFFFSKAWIHLSQTPYKITTFNLADIGEGIAEVELLKWHKNIGDQIEEMDELCEVQSDKAAVEISSRYSGRIVKIYQNVGDFVKIGGPLIDIEMEGEDDPVQVAAKPESSSSFSSHSSPFQETPTQSSKNQSFKTSPSTRRFAKEMNVDLSNVAGSGKDGRIEKVDVEEYIQNMNQSQHSTTKSETSNTPQPTSSVPAPKSSLQENQEVPLRGFPKAMFKSMTETAKVPQLWISEQMNITSVISMRQNMKEAAKKHYGINITITPIIVKAISHCLTKHPILNSKVDPNGEKYTIFGSHNVSIAVDTPNGLVVPNIKNVQDMSIVQIQSELSRLVQLAQSNKLSTADLTGGTVALSNVGVIGGTSIRPLVFDGQAMIIAIGRTQKLPRFDAKGNVVAHDIMDFGFTADHRHCDGATVARFATEMKEVMENPEIMFMEF